jgi:hypothetical protein
MPDSGLVLFVVTRRTQSLPLPVLTSYNVSVAPRKPWSDWRATHLITRAVS